MEALCSPAERDFRYAPSSLQGIFDCKEFVLIFYSLAFPTAELGRDFRYAPTSCGEYARCCSSALEVKYYAFGLKCLVPESLKLVRKPG
jgi:hypothetical protein